MTLGLCVSVYMFLNVCTCMSVCVRACVRVLACVCVYLHVCVCICMCVCVSVCVRSGIELRGATDGFGVISRLVWSLLSSVAPYCEPLICCKIFINVTTSQGMPVLAVRARETIRKRFSDGDE